MGPIRTYCDRIPRRDLLRVGAAGFVGGSLSLTDIFQRQGHAAPGTASTSNAKSDVSLIIVFLRGGLSTIDTVDMKPLAPPEVRGEFETIETNAPGVLVCEHLPRMARQMDKIALVRSFSHFDANHSTADHYVLTGRPVKAGFNPTLRPNNQHPSHGATISRVLGPRGSVPPYVCLPSMHASAGASFLGPSAAPFVVNADPNSPNFSVPDLVPPMTVDADRFESRSELRQQVDRFESSVEVRANGSARTMTTYQQKAFNLMTSTEAKSAFDIHRESKSTRDAYGRTSMGQCCLMARRLVEAGVRCVTIEHTNWDTHYAQFPALKNDLLPQLDGAVAGLFQDLSDRGLLDSTLVLVTGEFGRTPKVNSRAGRDHWSAVSTLILGGGGIRGGQLIGASNANAERPITDPISPEDLAATMFSQLGIDPQSEIHAMDGRPHMIVNRGRVIRELF